MKKNKKLQDLLEPAPPRVGSFKETQGDLIELGRKGCFDFIGHGCNCFSTMGAGIAKSIALEFPKMQKVDEASILSPMQKLGNFTLTNIGTTNGGIFTGINFYSQYLPGPSFDKEALTLSLRKFAMWHKDYRVDCDWIIGLPLIGCGIAGGDWEEVKELIQIELHEFDVTIVHFKSK